MSSKRRRREVRRFWQSEQADRGKMLLAGGEWVERMPGRGIAVRRIFAPPDFRAIFTSSANTIVLDFRQFSEALPGALVILRQETERVVVALKEQQYFRVD